MDATMVVNYAMHGHAGLSVLKFQAKDFSLRHSAGADGDGLVMFGNYSPNSFNNEGNE